MRLRALSMLCLPLCLWLLTGNVPAIAQSSLAEVGSIPSSIELRDQDTIGDFKRLIRDELRQRATSFVEERAEQKTTEAIQQKTTATAVPEGFAARVNDAIADFLPFFQFAVNTVSTSEDQRSVTVKFNPFKFAGGVVAVAGTAAEPSVFERLGQEIVETVRDSEREALLGGVDDLGDLTATLTYGFERQAGNWTSTRRLYGREFKRYEPLTDELIGAAWSVVSDEGLDLSEIRLARFVEELVPPGVGGLDSVTFGEIRKRGPQFEADLRAAVFDRVQAVDDFGKAIASLNLDALPALIDNQPQIVLEGSYRASDDVVGPDEAALSFRYEMGSRNFNKVLGRYRLLQRQRSDTLTPADPGELDRLKLDAFRSVVEDPNVGDEDKLVFSVTYKQIDDYRFEHDYTVDLVDASGAKITTPQHLSLQLDDTQEYRGKILWTRLMPSLFGAKPKTDGGTFLDLEEPAPDSRPRLSLSIESIWVDGDPLREDQVIGRLSYVLPLAGGATLPLTLTYANRSELLGDQDRVLSAHLGISYKMNRAPTP